jgi:hypothetical protein
MKKKYYIVSLIFILAQQATHAQYIIHIAGNDSMGHYGDGGLAVRASLNYPASICRDASGNLYIGDGAMSGTNDARVRKIDAATGIITTIAGGVHYPATATDTIDNIQATSARLKGCRGICIDNMGNLLIADGNNKVKKVNLSSGIITTVAGNGTPGYTGDGGPATAAQLAGVFDVAVDASNNIYIDDDNNSVIRRVDAVTGIITTVAGNGTPGYTGDGGPATSATLRQPYGIYIDSINNIYIAEIGNFAIRKVTATTGIITTIAGGTYGFAGDGGPATAAKFKNPVRITMDRQGNLYISDQGDCRIRKVNGTSGIISTFAGNGTPGGLPDSTGDNRPATAADILPYGICIDACGNLIMASTLCRIRAVTYTLPINGILCGLKITEVPTSPGLSKGEVRVYPNPATEELNITGIMQSTNYRLLTITGIVVQQGVLQSGSNTIQMRNCATGLYILEMNGADGTRSIVKVVKQ